MAKSQPVTRPSLCTLLEAQSQLNIHKEETAYTLSALLTELHYTSL